MSLKWAVFISGRGSNLQALLDCLDELRIVLVVCNKSDAPGIAKAKRLGIPFLIVGPKIDWANLNQELLNRNINRIFLCGFMRLVPESFLKSWNDHILNVHPSLLPEFPGLQAMEKSFQEKASMGVTVHIVIPEMDAGRIVLQKKVVDSKELQSGALTFQEVQLLMTKTEHLLVRDAARRLNLVGSRWSENK